MKLPRVAKEDLEEGREYAYAAIFGEHKVFGVVSGSKFYDEIRQQFYKLESMDGKFYGPIELEGE